MNKGNFQNVIDAIVYDEHAHFNMASFLGVANEHDHNDVYKKSTTRLGVSVTDIGTKIFNCNSTACIAGFATGLANDWKATPELVNEKIGENGVKIGLMYNSAYFEAQSNKYLDLHEQEGRNLYYGSHGSIWKYLKFNVPGFESLQVSYEDCEYNPDEYIDNDQEEDTDIGIELTSISPELAIKALKMIMLEEVILEDEDGNAGYGVNAMLKTTASDEV